MNTCPATVHPGRGGSTLNSFCQGVPSHQRVTESGFGKELRAIIHTRMSGEALSALLDTMDKRAFRARVSSGIVPARLPRMAQPTGNAGLGFGLRRGMARSQPRSTCGRTARMDSSDRPSGYSRRWTWNIPVSTHVAANPTIEATPRYPPEPWKPSSLVGSSPDSSTT